jgi:hypothetical protein
MRHLTAAFLSLAVLSCADGGPSRPDFGYPLDDVLRINHLQMKGTHNSYHLRPENPAVPDWDYSHTTLTEQLEKEGVRQFELDVHYNAEERRFETYHIPSLDDRSTCPIFKDCLRELLTWSDAHPGHHPLFVFIEPKDDIDQEPNVIYGHYDELDAEFLAVWPRDRIITPDDVKGKHATLKEAVLAKEWPTLGESRGKIVFVFLASDIEPGQHQYEYTHGEKDLNGRVMFVYSDTTDAPFAAILSRQDPIRDDAQIREEVAQGFIVRTMSDDSIDDRKAGKRDELDAAIAGAAQIISTDYPVDGPSPGYWLDLKGGTPTRCNPVTAPANCTSEAIESADHLQPITTK